jgi:putative transcriptional regulator
VINGYAQNRVQPKLEVLYEIAEILNVNVKDLLIDNRREKSYK